MQNGYIESFNGRMRDELLNESLFIDLDQARQLIGAWVIDYLLRDGMSVTPVAANLMLTVLRVLIEWGIPRGYRDDNPTIGLRRLVIEESGAQPWSEEAYGFVIDKAPANLRRMAFLGRATGQRASDLVRMRPADLADDGINVRIGKRRDKPHFVPLTKAQMREIRSWGVRDLDFFLTSASGRRCTALYLSQLWAIWRDGPEAAPLKGAKLTVHGLRATAVSDRRRAGIIERRKPLILRVPGFQTGPVQAGYRLRNPANLQTKHL